MRSSKSKISRVKKPRLKKVKIDVVDADEIITLLEELEAQSEDVSLDADILTELRAKIESLDVKNGLRKDLLKRVDTLENQRVLIKTLNNVSKKITKKGNNGKINDADTQEILTLLVQIENLIQ